MQKAQAGSVSARIVYPSADTRRVACALIERLCARAQMPEEQLIVDQVQDIRGRRGGRLRGLFLEPSTVGGIRSQKGNDTEGMKKSSGRYFWESSTSPRKRLPLSNCNVVVPGGSSSVLVTCIHL